MSAWLWKYVLSPKRIREGGDVDIVDRNQGCVSAKKDAPYVQHDETDNTSPAVFW